MFIVDSTVDSNPVPYPVNPQESHVQRWSLSETAAKRDVKVWLVSWLIRWTASSECGWFLEIYIFLYDTYMYISIYVYTCVLSFLCCPSVLHCRCGRQQIECDFDSVWTNLNICFIFDGYLLSLLLPYWRTFRDTAAMNNVRDSVILSQTGRW